MSVEDVFCSVKWIKVMSESAREVLKKTDLSMTHWRNGMRSPNLLNKVRLCRHGWRFPAYLAPMEE